MGKSKKADVSREENGDDSMVDGQGKLSWEDKVQYLSPIASPLASKKLTKKLYKIVGKAQASKSIRKGIKEVQKSLRKGEKGLVVLAGDVSPMDIISHIPIVCEEADIPYCYTPSKQDLGESCGSKRQACMVMIKKHDSYAEDFDDLSSKVGEIPTSY